MRREESRARAVEGLREYRASGLPRRRFCETAGIKLSTLTYWLKRERSADAAQEKKGRPTGKFIPVAARVTGGQVQVLEAPLVIVLGSGVRLEVPFGYPADEVGRVAAALGREQAC